MLEYTNSSLAVRALFDRHKGIANLIGVIIPLISTPGVNGKINFLEKVSFITPVYLSSFIP
jgi:hypothetical protein